MNQIVPALDLRDPADRHPNDPGYQAKPVASVEAEHSLLGCILFENSALERVTDALRPEHFYEPLHQRMWAAFAEFSRAGKLIDPVQVAERFRNDEAFADYGGISYLADLVDNAPPPANAPDYAETILDLALRRELITAAHDTAKAAREEWDVSARDHLEAHEQRLFALVEQRKSQGFSTFGDALTKAIDQAGAAFERDGGLTGLSTGLIDLDQRTGGLQPTDLIILAARPSMGKTGLATNIAFNVAKNYAWADDGEGGRKTVRGGIVAFFSLEMSEEQLAMRILADVSGVSSDRIRRGAITAQEFGRIRDAAAEIHDAPLHIDDTGGLSIAKLTQRARRLKRLIGLDLIVVDYLQLVTASKTRPGDNRVQEVSEITQALKALAKELNVPVLALSQLSRAVESREDKKPQLSDLRESGSIEQDADMVTFLYREAYYLGRQEPSEDSMEHAEWRAKMDRLSRLAELIIGKQRHGPIGTVHLAFDEALVRFGNLARDGGTETYGSQRLAFKDED